MNRASIVLLPLFLAGAVFTPEPAAAPAAGMHPHAAAAGALDPAFGSAGKVTTDFPSQTDWAYAVAIQKDGKIVAAGRTQVNNQDDFGLARYQTNGSLDDSFGSGGKVITDFGTNNDDRAFAVAVQKDGKIVAAGFTFDGTSRNFGLARYNANGTLDDTFGVGGLVDLDFSGRNDEAKAVVIQKDGKIVAAGYATSPGMDFALARFNADGTLDDSFGAGGLVTTDFNAGADQANGVAIQKDGRIVVAGSADKQFALARYNSGGTPDSSFGPGGKVTTQFGGVDDEATSVAIQKNGRIVLAGLADIGGNFDFALSRYTKTGTLDSSFGVGGKVTTDLTANDIAFAVAIQKDGKIVAAGSATFAGTSFDFALARFKGNGSLDTRFGSGGKVTTDFFGGIDEAYGVAIQKDGKIVAAGRATNNGDQDFALARYLGK